MFGRAETDLNLERVEGGPKRNGNGVTDHEEEAISK